MSYKDLSGLLKVLSSPTRLEILDILSCEELCAYDLLAYFKFSQPTLSHHMKSLVDNHLVNTLKLGNKKMYALNHKQLEQVTEALGLINTSSKPCICQNIGKGDCSS